MNTHFFKKTFTWLLNFIHLQVFITLIMLPILIFWGLPISLLSPLGNLIFTPILTAFLILSSLVFFTELFHLPNALFIFCLEKISLIWMAAMKTDRYPWLFGFKKPSLIIAFAIPILALLVLHFKRLHSTYISIVCYCTLLIISFSYLKYIDAADRKPLQSIPCNKGSVTLIHVENQLILIDPGVIGQRISAPSWIEYTLMPDIIKTTGKTEIDLVIVLQPSLMTFQAMQTLVSKMRVHTLYLITWQGTAPKNWWRSFFAFNTAMNEHATTLHRVGTNEINIPLSNGTITITPLEQTIKDKELSYQAVKVTTAIAKQSTETYSYKYKKKPPQIDK